MAGSVRSMNDVLKCEICGTIFHKRESLLSHIADVHSQTRKFCFVCKRIFGSKADLTIHNLVSHDTSFFNCGRGKCLSQFKTEDELQAHFEDKHLNSVKRNSPKQKLPCKHCDEKFAKAKSLLKHKVNKHKVGNVYICSKCQFCSDSVEGLMQHERREHRHPPMTLPSTKPHIILDGKPIIFCKECKKEKFCLGTDLITHMRLRHRSVINNKGAGEWKCGECKQEFKQANSLNHHFIAKHKPKKELVDQMEVVKEEEALLEIDIKIEIKSEPPGDQNEYYENWLEMTDLKTEVIYDNDHGGEPECTLEETLKDPVYQLAKTDFNIKQEYSVIEDGDYKIKVEESDEQMVLKDLKKETSGVIFNQIIKDEVEEVELKQDRKSGMIRVNLPAKFDKRQDDFIKEFFEASYGKIIKFDNKVQKQKGLKTFCWITFEDEKSAKFLDKQGFVMLDGCRLKTVAYEHSESEESCLLCQNKRHAGHAHQVPRSIIKQKLKGRSKKKNKKTKQPILAQLPAQPIQTLNTSEHQVIPPPQVSARPPQFPARPPSQFPARPPQFPARPLSQFPARPPQFPARPPSQFSARPPQFPTKPPPQFPTRPPHHPAMPSTSYYGYQNQPYGWSWGQAGRGYYPTQFGSAHWSGDRTHLGRPYCYYDDAGKLVQRRGVNVRMWPY